MEAFFNNSMVFIFFFAMLSIFNYTDMRMEQRLSIIYVSVCAMTLLGTIGARTAYLFLFLALFCYLEIFTTDTKKLQILVNPFYKLIDCFYLAFSQYGLFFVLVSVGFLSNTLILWVGKYAIVLKAASLVFLAVAITNTLRQKFVLNTFKDMYWIFNQYPIYQVEFDKELNQACYILTAIEDKRYFERKGYTILDGKHLASAIKRKLRKKSLGQKIRTTTNFIGGIITFKRGYSTIPMQLVRSLGVKRGYECRIRRKFYELIYPQMFFGGMRREMEEARTTNRNKFNQYLLYIYFHVVKTDLGDGRYRSFLGVFDSKNKGKKQKDIQQCSKEGIFIACMGLSGRAKKINEESIDYYLESIPGTLDRHTILELKAKMMSRPYGGNYLL